jgi:hypothetical protein
MRGVLVKKRWSPKGGQEIVIDTVKVLTLKETKHLSRIITKDSLSIKSPDIPGALVLKAQLCSGGKQSNQELIGALNCAVTNFFATVSRNSVCSIRQIRSKKQGKVHTCGDASS